MKQARFPSKLLWGIPNLSCTYSNIFHLHAEEKVRFAQLGSLLMTTRSAWTPKVDFYLFIYFFNQGISSGFLLKRKRQTYSILSLSPFPVDWIRGFEGRWVGSRWISEIHLCTNAYCLREGNFLQLCSPAHSCSPSSVTRQCFGECIVLWLMPKEKTVF